MEHDSRSELAERQAALVAALTDAGPLPEGFARERVTAAAEALARKRLRSARRAWPSLAAALGARFDSEFERYAASRALPVRGGPPGDARAFVHWLEDREPLPNVIRLEAMRFDLEYRLSPQGYVSRRGPSIELRLLGRPRRLAIGFRVPLLGACRLCVPLPRRGDRR